MMKMIVINGRFLTQRITGVQRFALEFVKSLDKLVEVDDIGLKLQFVIMAPRDIITDIKLK